MMINTYEKRQAKKARRAAYTEIARRQYLQPDDGCAIKIPEHVDVQEVEDGAFVEALIWVPREKTGK